MKKNILHIAFLLVIAMVSCKKNAAERVNDAEAEKAKERAIMAKVGFPEMTFTQTEYDFGTVEEGTIVEGQFEYINTGKSDLIVTAAKASCGCTVPEYVKDKPIKTGEKGYVKFKFDTHGRTDNQHKTITIRANTKNENEEVKIKGFVKPKK